MRHCQVRFFARLAGTFLAKEIDTAGSRIRLMDVVERADVATAGRFDAAKTEASRLRVGVVDGGAADVTWPGMGRLFITSINDNEFQSTNPATSTGTKAESVWRRVK